MNWLNDNTFSGNKKSLWSLFVFSQNGENCLHVAVWQGRDAIVEELIQAGADVNLRDKVSKP